MKTIKGIDGRVYSHDILISRLSSGEETEAQIAAKIGDAAAKRLAKRASRPVDDRVCIYGKIIRQTEKAILFQPAQNHQGTANLVKFSEAWFPLALASVLDDALVGMTQLTVSSKVLDQKNSENQG